jgi:O-methyltransferase
MAGTKDSAMKGFIKKIFQPDKSKSKAAPEKWQSAIMNDVEEFTMTSHDNILSLINAVKYISENNIPGEIVECGVWKGGSMMAIAKSLLYFGQANRSLYLYDSFDEFSSPEAIDISFEGKHGSEVLKDLAQDGNTWKASEMSSVKKNMLQTGYPENLLFFVKGKVEETIPGTTPEKIALLRLDTDWYASTRHELEWLYPKLSKGGILIIDDYGYWQGCKKAADEYFKKENINSPLVEIDASARLMYK